LIITADHGNDPGLKTGLHTREMTPLLVYSRAVPPVLLGDRASLSDVGASLVDFFSLPKTQDGNSFIPELNEQK
jgi:phosphopentomutase